MESFQEKQQRKKARYQELAQKNKEQSKFYANKDNDKVPMGQPIQIGHHSEQSHKRHIERLHRNMEKSIEFEKKAKYYENKIDNIDNPKFIHSQDPEAVTKLKQKLADLEKERERVKQLPIKPRDYSFSEIDMRSVSLQNLGAQIRQVKKRISDLENKVRNGKEND